MDISVIIPTYRRHAKLAACVSALAAQRGPSFEVLIGVDGEDAAAEAAARRAWGERPARDLVVAQGPRAGLAAVRNRTLPSVRGRYVVSLNDDVIPGAGFLAAHLAAQRDAERAGRPAIIVGRTPWVVHEPDTLFARLVRETSMVFFHDVMEREADRERDWGFRHAWPLNLSVPAAIVRELGGWTVFPATYGFEDDEFAWRAIERFGVRVLYRREALAMHDHAMTPREYLEREYRLGFAAPGFANTSPACAAAMFGRDIRAEAERAYTREFVARERKDAARLLGLFLSWGDLRAHDADGPNATTWIRAAYQQHLLLKRWTWRRGFVDAAAGRAMDPGAAVAELGAA